MSTHVTERDGKGTITVSPRTEAAQSGLMVICHGLGDSAEGFADVAEVCVNFFVLRYYTLYALHWIPFDYLTHTHY
jgi:hypothetical protein